MAGQTGRRQRWLMVSALILGLLATVLVALPGAPVSVAQVRAASPGSWTITGDPIVPRYINVAEDITAVRLVGGQVLLFGGYTSADGDVTTECELYDPTTGQFTTAASLNDKRAHAAAVMLADTRILVTGSAGRIPHATAEIYSHSTNTWASVASMNTGRYDHALYAMPNGKVLAVGGRTTLDGPLVSSAEVYDLGANSWTAAPSMTSAAITTVQLGDGSVLAIHGDGISETYDPNRNIWLAAGRLNIARESGFIANLLPNGKVLLLGGLVHGVSDGAKRMELYDPVTRQWTLSAPLYQSRTGPYASVLLDGTLLVFGGNYYQSQGDTPHVLSSFEKIDLTTYVSSPVTSTLEDAVGPTVLLQNADILSIGFRVANTTGELHHSLRYTGPTGLAKVTFDTGNTNGDLTIDFGQVVAGTPNPVTKSVTLTNSGGGAVTVTQVQLPSGGPVYVYQSTAPNDCVNKTLQHGQSCTITIGFQPPAGTQYNGQLAIYTNASTAPTNIPLYGSGSSGFAPSSFDFGSVPVGNTSAPSPTMFTNNRTTPITISSAGPSPAILSNGGNANDFALASNSCTPGRTLQPQESCTMILTFTPSAAGQETGELDVNLNNGPTLIAGIKGVGSGDNLPKITTSPASIQFTATPINSLPNGAGTNYRKHFPLQITNSGRQAMQMQTNGNSFCIQEGTTCAPGGSPTISGFGIADWNDCDGKVLQPGDSCVLSMMFAPNPGSEGWRYANLQITPSHASGYPVPAQNPTSISISGYATNSPVPSLGIYRGDPIKMPNPQAIGGSEQFVVDLYNYGNAPLTITTVDFARYSLNASDFKLGTNCNNITLAPNNGCQATLTFTPTRPGVRYTTVLVNSNDTDGGGTKTDLITGTATGTVIATIDTGAINLGSLPAAGAQPQPPVWHDAIFHNTGQTPVIAAGSGNIISDNGAGILAGNTGNTVHANTASADYHIDFANSTCAQTKSLEPGQTCTVRVQFAPATMGTHPAQLQISGLNDNATHTASLTGDGANGFPTVSGLSDRGGQTTGGTNLTINGTGYQAGAHVYFGAVGGPGVTPANVSGTSVTITTPALAAGDYNVYVVNPDGHGSNAGRFTVVPPNFIPTIAPHATVAPAITMPQAQPNSGQHPTPPPPMMGGAMPTATPLPQPGRH